MTPKQIGGLAALFAGVVVVSSAIGVGTAWLLYRSGRSQPLTLAVATTQPASTRPAGPTTRPAPMAAAQGVTLTGKAVCGTCFLDLGPVTRHPVVLETATPYRTFLLATNDQLAQIEAITGSCAGGDIELTATGDVLLVNGRNVLIVRSFTHRELDAPVTTQPDESS